MVFDIYQFGKFICTIPADSPEFRFSNLWDNLSESDKKAAVNVNQWLQTLKLVPRIAD